VKKILFASMLIFLCSCLLFGQGIKYKGEVRMEGVKNDMSKEDQAQMKSMGMGSMDRMDFEAMAQGGKYKMVYLNDFAFIKAGSYILGDSDSKIAYWVFPEKKTYWEMNIDELGKSADRMQKMVKMTYSNQAVSVTALPPKMIGVLPCTGKRIKVAYDTQTSMMGMKSKAHTEEQTDYYTTASYNVLEIFGGHNWQSQGTVTGDKEFDMKIAAEVGFLGFPVQVVTQRWDDGKDSGKTTLTTRDIQLTVVPAGNFGLPPGYTKEEAGGFSIIKDMIKGQDGGQKDEAGASTEDEQGGDKKEDDKSDKIDPKTLLKKGLKKILK
jgi:hypothetical protein